MAKLKLQLTRQVSMKQHELKEIVESMQTQAHATVCPEVEGQAASPIATTQAQFSERDTGKEQVARDRQSDGQSAENGNQRQSGSLLSLQAFVDAMDKQLEELRTQNAAPRLSRQTASLHVHKKGLHRLSKSLDSSISFSKFS